MMRIYEVTKIVNFTFIYFEMNLKCMLKGRGYMCMGKVIQPPMKII